MFGGLDYLGASTLTREAAKAKAAQSGQRAMAAAQRIAKTAPRLSAAVQKAGQRALAASSKGTTQAQPKPAAAAQTPAKPAMPPRQPTPPMARRQAAGPSMMPGRMAAFPRRPTTVPGKMPPRMVIAPKKTRVGEDVPSDESAEQEAQETEQADIYSQLADAAVNAANFVAGLQGLLSQLPPGVPLIVDGQTRIENIQNGFVTPLEAVLSGGSTLNRIQVQALIDLLQAVIDQRNTPIWNWVANANAYLKVHPPTVTISPQGAVIAPGATQLFSVSVKDPNGRVVTPAPAVDWTASTGGTIDPNGAFTAQAPGNYTVTASAGGGASATASVTVQEGAGGGAGLVVAITPQNPTVMPNAPVQLSGSVTDTMGRPVSPQPQITWSTTAPASISPAGVFIAPTAGSFTVTATAGGATGTTSIAVGATAVVPPSGGYGGGMSGGGGGSYGGESYDGGAFDSGDAYGSDGGPDYYVDDSYQDEMRESQDAEPQYDYDTFDDGVDYIEPDDYEGSGLDAMGMDMLGDSWAAIHVPDDYRNAAKALKASADNLNLTAANEPGWQAIYAVANDLYGKYADIGFFGGLTLTDAAWNAIADAQQRVNEFEAQMRARGKALVVPEHKPVDTNLLGPQVGGALEWAKNHWGWLAAAGVAAVVLPVAVPPLVSLAAARKVMTR